MNITTKLLALFAVNIVFTFNLGATTAADGSALTNLVMLTNGTFYPKDEPPAPQGNLYNGQYYPAINPYSPDAGWHADINSVFLQAAMGQHMNLNLYAQDNFGYSIGGGEAGLYAALGCTNEAGLLSLFGYTNEASMVAAYGQPSYADLVRNFGFTATGTNGLFQDYGVTNEAGLLASMGASSEAQLLGWNSWRTPAPTNLSELAVDMGYGGTVADAQRFNTNIGGVAGIITSMTTADVLANPTMAPKTDAQKAALIAALSVSGILPADVTHLVAGDGGITTSTDPAFQNAVIATLIATGKTSTAQTLLGNIAYLGTAGVDYTSWTPAPGDNIVSLSQGMGLTTTQLSSVSGIQGGSFGTMSLSGFTMASGQAIHATDFSSTRNFSGAMLNNGGSVGGSNFSGLNLAGFSPNSGLDISGANFSNSQNLTPAMLAQAGNIGGAVVTGTGITKAAVQAALITAGKDPTPANWLTY